MKDWQRRFLRDDIILISGQHLLSDEYHDEAVGIPYLTGPSDYSSGIIKATKFTNSPKSMCEKGDILITVKGSGTGKTIIADKAYCISRQLMAVRPKTWDPYFLWYSVILHEAKYENTSVGLIPGISRDDVLETPILIPDIKRQFEIGKRILIWDQSIDIIQRLISAKQDRRKWLMQQLLTGKKRLSKYKKNKELRKTPFGMLPTDWGYPRMGDVAQEVSERNGDKSERPVLSCTKHQGLVDSLTYFGKRIFSEDLSNYKIVRRGQFAYATNHIDEGSIGYQDTYDEALISPIYTVFQTNDEMDDRFLFMILKTETYRHIFASNTSASVDRRGSLRWSDFAKIHVPCPSLEEQQAIVKVVSTADREIDLLRAQLDALREQKKGLMQQLLTGKIRVKV